jgi:hypothetical protein
MTINIPKNRICPSCSCKSCSNKRRHRSGEIMGIKPSRMSMRPSASRRDSLNIYFLGDVPPPEPRMALKKSELPGSSTITSDLLANVVL